MAVCFAIRSARLSLYWFQLDERLPTRYYHKSISNLVQPSHYCAHVSCSPVLCTARHHALLTVRPLVRKNTLAVLLATHGVSVLLSLWRTACTVAASGRSAPQFVRRTSLTNLQWRMWVLYAQAERSL